MAHFKELATIKVKFEQLKKSTDYNISPESTDAKKR